MAGAAPRDVATPPPRGALKRSEGSRGTYSDSRGSVSVVDAFDEFSGDEYARKLYVQLAKIPVIGEGVERMTKAGQSKVFGLSLGRTV